MLSFGVVFTSLLVTGTIVFVDRIDIAPGCLDEVLIR